MQTEISYILSCEYGVVDRYSKPTAAGIFSNVNLDNKDKPVLMPVYLVGLINFVNADKKQKANLEFIIQDSLGSEIAKASISGEVPENANPYNVNFVVKYPLVSFEKIGIYSLVVTLNGEPIKKIEKCIEVRIKIKQ